jgi:hypothetical protein
MNMAKKETNDAKRVEMKQLVEAAVAKGWTNSTLAAFFGYSSFGPFANGKSMGTNELRAQLRQIESPAVYARLVAKRIAELEAKIAKDEVRRALAQAMPGALTEEEWRNGPLKEYIAQYPDRYTYAAHLESTARSKAWHINKAETALDTHRKWLNTLIKATR